MCASRHPSGSLLGRFAPFATQGYAPRPLGKKATLTANARVKVGDKMHTNTAAESPLHFVFMLKPKPSNSRSLVSLFKAVMVTIVAKSIESAMTRRAAFFFMA